MQEAETRSVPVVTAEEFMRMNDNSPINILYCNLNYVITYMNNKSKETLKRIEEFLPISVNEVVT
jgi:methyl-accepting chemotaxis protein